MWFCDKNWRFCPSGCWCKGRHGSTRHSSTAVCSACLIMQIVFDFETLSSLHGALLSWFHFTRLMLGMFRFSQYHFATFSKPLLQTPCINAMHHRLNLLYEWLFCDRHSSQMHFSWYQSSQSSTHPQFHQQRKSLNKYCVGVESLARTQG